MVDLPLTLEALAAAEVPAGDAGVKLTKAQRRRIEQELKYPYDGVMYDGKRGAQRKGLYLRFRQEDVEAILRAALSGERVRCK